MIVHADDALVVIDKPAGLLSVPGRGPDKADNAALRVQALFADALIVHRLDMATSGLLLLARNDRTWTLQRRNAPPKSGMSSSANLLFRRSR